MVPRALMSLGVLASTALALQGSAAARVADGLARPAGAEAKAPVSYKGGWFGTTGQGKEISFTVNKRNRVTLLRFSWEVEGDGCQSEVEKTIRGAVASISGKVFRVTGQTATDSFTLTGRFTSKTAAAGKLTAASEGASGCSGAVSTSWKAKKGKRPPPPASGTYDGSWQGPVSFPTGLDPAIAALADPTIEFRIEDGAVTSMSAPWVIQGAGCQAALTGRILKTLEPPVPLSGSQLAVSFSSSAVGTKTWAVAGAFASPTSASGTVTMSGTSGIIGVPGGCTGTLEASWQATRQ